MSLVQICIEAFDDKKKMISLSLNKTQRQNIVNATAWMDKYFSKIPLKIRCLVVKEGYDEISYPRCVCGKPTSFDKEYNDHLNEFCSDKCRKARQRLSDQATARLNDREWLWQRRMVDQRAITDIAAELGCSITPIKNALKRFDIPTIRLNESRPVVRMYLENKKWLYEQHVVKQRTLEDIANEIGSSKATLSIALTRHRIIANASNIYPRKHVIVSRECQEVVDFLIQNDEEVILNNRDILNGSELDIVLPQLKLAIEYNGLYSHIERLDEASLSKRKDRNYHLNKTLHANEKGYQLIHIFSDDWKYRNPIWKSILLSRIGKSERIYARKCQFSMCNYNEKMIFLANNHLQGNDHASINLGLYYNGELVAIMTFMKSRYNKNFTWELSRYCCTKNKTVVGGFSKLLKEFEKQFKGNIVSYADRSRSNGDVYRKNGFDLIRINSPSYSYVNFAKKEQRQHKSNFRKHQITEPGDLRPEWEIMLEKGYHRIWDCGLFVFGRD